MSDPLKYISCRCCNKGTSFYKYSIFNIFHFLIPIKSNVTKTAINFSNKCNNNKTSTKCAQLNDLFDGIYLYIKYINEQLHELS